VLRRALKSILESLDGLIKQQEHELAALDARVVQKQDLDGLDGGMIRLNQNTLGVLDLAQGTGGEVGPVAKLIERASDSQVAAITELRFPMADAKSVRGHESRSLDLLKQARDKAKDLDERIAQRQREEKMRELRKAYTQILEAQVAVREETQLLAALDKFTRRDRQIARGLAERQTLIRDDLAALVRESEDLAESKLFEYAHTRLDARASSAIEELDQVEPKQAMPDQVAVERGIRNILEALKDQKPDERPFSAPEGGGGGGGGQGGQGNDQLIPPLKELVLLRLIQTDIAERTVELNGGESGGDTLKQLAEDQRSLMEVGREFLESLKDQGPAQQQNAPPEEEGGGAPGPEVPNQPDGGQDGK